MIHTSFHHNIVIVGFGSIGRGVLPLILRHIDVKPEQITIIEPNLEGKEIAERYNVRLINAALTQDNYQAILTDLLQEGDFLLNVSVDVSSLALIQLCQERGALYLDTCIEPWLGGYTDPDLSPSLRTNYALREKALALRQQAGPDAPTAVITHGANPGLVSYFVKKALLNLAESCDISYQKPTKREDWGKLAQQLGVKVIHIAERDTQVANIPKKIGEFVNTWSIEGFVGEGAQPAELGWGSHEKELPPEGRRHDFGSQAAIYLMRPGASTRVRTWTPTEGPCHGFLITHGESISIADYLSVKDNQDVIYRPTVHYSYYPCDDAVLSLHEFAGHNWTLQEKTRLLMDEIVSGIDELGVLLMGHAKGAYWYGSQLSTEEARRLVPHNNATSLQVAVTVLAGMIWAITNPQRGVVEPDEIDYEFILDICMPYLGPVKGHFTDWTPLEGRNKLFPEDVDLDEPWQFKNIIVR